jgi:hypothetical protein
MAVSNGTIAGSYMGTTLIEDLDANETVETYIDNTNNSGTVYLKLYETTGSVTVGSDHPSFVFPCAGSVTRQFNFPDGIAYATGLKAACVTSAGTDGNTGPSSDVIVRVSIG